MSPRGPWFPHPDNWTASARRQLVKSLKECVSAAQDANVYLCLEGHQLVTLESAAVTKAILDKVGSPWVRSDYDSANWITRETVFDTATVLNRDFDTLGQGQHTAGATVNPYQYTGQQFDSATGLYDLRARYYGPATGRFLSQDKYPSDLYNPIELNRFVYASNNTVNKSDPSGMVMEGALIYTNLSLKQIAILASLAVAESCFVMRVERFWE